MLELKKLCLTANDENGKAEILKNIDLTVEDKKFIVITGPNGGGKTTLAKTVMGLAKPTSGRIIWNGEDITDLSITDRSACARATISTAMLTRAFPAARSSASRSRPSSQKTQS